MAFISGGGSRGGGFHGGGFRGGSRGSFGGRGGYANGSGAPISSSPYQGARKYRYFRHGRWHYFYTAREGKMPLALRIICGLCFLPVLVISGAGIILPIVQQYRLFHHRDTEIIIKDEAHVLKDQTALRKSMSDFYEKTKIVPAVITVSNEDWYGRYDEFDTYALERYPAEFHDELHWLIVYSEPKTPSEKKDDPFNDWYWSSIQGDHTNRIITRFAAQHFNLDFHQRLTQTDHITAEDLAASIDLTADKADPPEDTMVPELSCTLILPFLFFLVLTYFGTGLHEFKYRHAELDPDSPDVIDHDAPGPYEELRVYQKDTCMYCGAEYYKGVRTCPKCGAALPLLTPGEFKD